MSQLSIKSSKTGTVTYWIGRSTLKILGWKVEGTVPDIPKFVVIAAPHTSNWDFIVMLAGVFSLGIKVSWMGKDNLFKGPLGKIFTWLGGIPTRRTVSTNMVDQVAGIIRSRKKMILLLSPEGTRKKTDHWKTGFYYIALKAEVPLVLAFADYQRKVAGIGPVIYPSGDIEADLELIRPFYNKVKGKYPEKFGEIRIKS